jgi:hypothetical protein
VDARAQSGGRYYRGIDKPGVLYRFDHCVERPWFESRVPNMLGDLARHSRLGMSLSEKKKCDAERGGVMPRVGQVVRSELARKRSRHQDDGEASQLY